MTMHRKNNLKSKGKCNMVLLFLGLIALGVVCASWRVNLILNHPEQEERLQEYERRRKEARHEMFKKAAPVVGTGAKLLFRVLTRGRRS